MRQDRSSLSSNTLLHAGFSFGEGLCVLALLGILTGLAISEARKAPLHLATLEPIFLSSGLKTEWVVHWAETGEYPDNHGAKWDRYPVLPSGLVDSKGDYVWKRILNVSFAETNGVFGFTLDESNSSISGQTISFRPAIAGGHAPTAVLWVCGHALAPPGFVLVGENTTTIANEDLPSPCRSAVTHE